MASEAKRLGMTPAEVAGRLALSPNAVYLLLASGKLGSYRVGPGGGRHLISDEHLADYLSSCESGPKRAKAAATATTSPPAFGCRGKIEGLDGMPLKHY